MKRFVFSLFILCTASLGYTDRIYLPSHVGFSDSLFQTSGLGTSASATPFEFPGECNWQAWLNPEAIEGTIGENYKKFFVDILKNPDPFIAILKEMGVTAHRFSLEWSVLEPCYGMYNEEAIDLYTQFIHKLRDAGIEPYVTLHHFVHPQWFEELGGFTKEENIKIYVKHASAMIDMFPEVRYWMTFNEPGVYAFQGFIRGVYPPGHANDLYQAGHVMRNMLMAHCGTYLQVKGRYGGKKQIGITHQWLKFVPLDDSPLEVALCSTLSNITHYPVYNFLKTGKFEFILPCYSDLEFSIPEEDFEKNHHYVDFVGMQFYGFPQLKAGWNGGDEYPGYGIQNLNICGMGITFGSTCPPGGKVGSFGVGFYPDSMKAALEEAKEIGVPIAITETGCDANTQKWGSYFFERDDATQKEYFEKILPILEEFQKETNQLQALFVWTVFRDHLEWDRGNTPSLGLISIDRRTILLDGQPLQKIHNPKYSEAANYLKKAFKG